MKKKKITLALDLGAITGWAIQNLDTKSSGSITLNKQAPIRHLEYYNWLENLILAQEGLEVIAYEQVMFNGAGVKASHWFGYYSGVVQLFADKYNIEIITQTPNEIKKFARDNTPPYYILPIEFIKQHGLDKLNNKAKMVNKNKIDTITFCYNKGYRPIDSNEADSLVLLDMVKSLIF